MRDFVSVAQFYETLLYWTGRGRYRNSLSRLYLIFVGTIPMLVV